MRVVAQSLYCRGWFILLTVVAVSCDLELARAAGTVSATIFVGRHFEVRDHDQPVKFVFNGQTRAAAITGSVSSNERIQRLRLYAGWNLLSLAVNTADFVGQVRSQRPGEMESIYQWNPATGGYSEVVPGEALAAGTMLWTKAAGDGAAGVSGSYESPSDGHIPPGEGYVAGMGLEAWTPQIPGDASVWLYQAESQSWREQLAGDLSFLSASVPTIAPGQTVYVRASNGADLTIPDPRLRIRYYHQDHLGSTSAITDAAGALVEESAYYSYGLARNEYRVRPIEKNYSFTQKERDRENGLHYFETRYLASVLGRFTRVDRKYASPDLLSKDDGQVFLAAPQRINLYSYVGNNPINHIDPFGEDSPKSKADEGASSSSVTLTLTGGAKMTFEVTSAQFGEPGGSRTTARPTQEEGVLPRDLVITKTLDKKSAELFRMAMGGSHGSVEGELSFQRVVNGRSEVFMKVELHEVIISGYSVSSGGSNPTESITLNAQKIEFAVQKPENEKQTEGNGSRGAMAPSPKALEQMMFNFMKLMNSGTP